MFLLSTFGAIAAAEATAPEEGTYEPTVMGLTPALYLKFAETSGAAFADSSAHGRSGLLQGSGATLGATALAPNVGASNKALDLGGAAWVEIPHAAADVALTFPSSAPWNQAGFRRIADCTISLWFEPNSLPTGSNKHVILSKSSGHTPGEGVSYDGSWEAYMDSNGAVHVECRSFRGRPCRIRTPNSAVFAGASNHLVVQFACDGVAAWLNGAKCEDGYGNLLHVYGLAADIRGTKHENTFAWMIGKAAWGGQADLIVDELAIYLATLTQGDAEALAQVGSTAPLAHHIWGAATSGPHASISAIQSAIDSLSAGSGGTVLMTPGTYTGNITLKSKVRLKANGGTVTINGSVSTPSIGYIALTDDGSDFMTGDRTLDVSNNRAVGDVIKIMATTGNPSPMRHDRRWNTTSESNDPNIPDGEAFLIESRTSSAMTFVGNGSYYDFAEDDRQSVSAFTPTSWVAVEGPLVVQGNANPFANIRHTVHGRFVGVTATTNDVGGRAIRFDLDCIYCQVRDCEAINAAGATSNNGGIYCTSGSKDIVIKDCIGRNGRHGQDLGGAPGTGPVTRIEIHDHRCIDQVQRAAFGAHGPCSDCIWWNITATHGGCGVCGWRADVRWIVAGSADNGDIIPNDGLFESYFRDFDMNSPHGWFQHEEGSVGVVNNHFENIQHSATPTGNINTCRFSGNTRINVDTPPPA